jgi:hypothetical protein
VIRAAEAKAIGTRLHQSGFLSSTSWIKRRIMQIIIPLLHGPILLSMRVHHVPVHTPGSQE